MTATQSPTDYIFLDVFRGDTEVKREGAMSRIRTAISCSTVAERPGIQDILPVILRLSVQSPFKDVREGCHSILQIARTLGFNLPKPATTVSKFIPPSGYDSRDAEVPVPGDTDTEEVHGYYVDLYKLSGRVDNVIQVLALHPRYLRCFLEAHAFLVTGKQSPLLFKEREFIGLIAASRMKCDPLQELQKQRFLAAGGSREWLDEELRDGYRCLSQLDRVLAYRPWLLGNKETSELLRTLRKTFHNQKLVHAGVLLCHFHCLAGLYHGCGVNVEIDFPGGWKFDRNHSPPVGGDSPPHSGRRLSVSDPLGGGMLNGHDGGGDEQLQLVQMMRDSVSTQSSKGISREENRRAFSALGRGGVSPTSPSDGGRAAGGRQGASRYAVSPEYGYVDPEVCDENTTTANAEWHWESHGYGILEKYMDELPLLMGARFERAQRLTYFNIGEWAEREDTIPFRNAVWYFVHRLFGILHDNFNYKNSELLLNPKFKRYITLVACQPHKVCYKDYSQGRGNLFRHSEMVHINIMIMEAKLQAQLLYFLKAISLW